MELIEDWCHWCETRITRPSVNMLWIDDYESAECEFHPAVFDSATLTRYEVTAPHMTIKEVHEVVKANYEIKVRQRDKTVGLRAIDSNVVSMASRPRTTSRKAAEKMLPRSGSVRREVYEWITRMGGRTDYELETELKSSHQTISASRRSLVVDGWLIDSGTTRQNKSGNDCIVWVTSSINSGMLFDVR